MLNHYKHQPANHNKCPKNPVNNRHHCFPQPAKQQTSQSRQHVVTRSVKTQQQTVGRSPQERVSPAIEPETRSTDKQPTRSHSTSTAQKGGKEGEFVVTTPTGMKVGQEASRPIVKQMEPHVTSVTSKVTPPASEKVQQVPSQPTEKQNELQINVTPKMTSSTEVKVQPVSPQPVVRQSEPQVNVALKVTPKIDQVSPKPIVTQNVPQMSVEPNMTPKIGQVSPQPVVEASWPNLSAVASVVTSPIDVKVSQPSGQPIQQQSESQAAVIAPDAVVKVGQAIPRPIVEQSEPHVTGVTSQEPAKSILKTPRDSSNLPSSEGNITPILKKKLLVEEPSHPSILKKRISDSDMLVSDPKPVTSILKRDPEKRLSESDMSDHKPVSSILKRDSTPVKRLSEGDISEHKAIASILKRESTPELDIPKEIKPILKKESAFDSKLSFQSSDSAATKEIKPILKKESSFEKPTQMVTSSILVQPQMQQKQPASPPSILKSSKQFMLQKSKSLGDELPAETQVSVLQTTVSKPILRKAKTFDFTGEIDPELAATLKARRGSSEESEKR